MMSPSNNNQTIPSSTSIEGLAPCISSALVNVRTSSQFNANHGHQHILLNSHSGNQSEASSAWCAMKNDVPNQYVMLGGELRTFMAITTQGRSESCDQWVTTYKIQYSIDGLNFFDYQEGMAVIGNSDKDTPVTHFFNPPIYARVIKVIPYTFHNHISMRMELYSRLQ